MVTVTPLPARHDSGGLLIVNAAVVTVDDTATIHDPGWVHVVGDTIAAVGAGAAPPAVVGQAERVIDADGCALMPGMTKTSALKKLANWSARV